jgi:hypothetical protein
MKKIYCAAIIFIFVLWTPRFAGAQVVINEFSCSNLSQFVDDHSDYEDWIELYNTSATAINMAGYYLSDDSTNNIKWQIPAGITINGNSFLRFWTSGRNIATPTGYHTNFKLTQTKNTEDFVVLSNPSAIIIDYVKLNNANNTQLGHSRGRQPNGAATWFVFTTPTPNSSNNASAIYLGYAAKPSFDLAAGFYPSAVTVTITNNEPSSTIYYTTDGTLPTTASAIYSSPITISTTKILKALAKSTNLQLLSSLIEYNTYFINVNHTMSVVSIAATQLNTLANGSGSLTPSGSMEYFDTLGVRRAKTYGGFNRHGQDSWALNQRSLDFAARDEMGYDYTIRHQMFPQTPRDKFQRITLRAAGDDNFPADGSASHQGDCHVRDAYVHMLAKNGGMDLDVRRAVKTIVYLNGQYWGIYDIREKPDDHDYTDYYYGQDKFHLQYLEYWGGWIYEYGGMQARTDWEALRSYILSNSMVNQANFDSVATQLDMISLADYVLVNSFVVCSDWLNWNTGWWRGTDTTGGHRKWGYILWDNDATFNYYINYTNVPSTQYNALICGPQTQNATYYSDPLLHLDVLSKLLTNPTFNTWYINRAIDLSNSVFGCTNMLQQLDSIVALLTPEMPAQCARWGGVLTTWQTNIQTLRNFIINRCNYLSTTGFIDCYSLTGPYNIVLNVDPPGAGNIQLNSLSLTQFPWTGTYYGNITTSIAANVGNTSYVFNNWTTLGQLLNPNLYTASVTANITNSDTITAHFSIITAIGNYSGAENSVSVYPTAFSDETTIEYMLTERAPVSIKLISMLGTEVAQIKTPEEFLSRGSYSVKLNLAGSGLSSGIYLLKFTAGDFSKTIKLVYSPR